MLVNALLAVVPLLLPALLVQGTQEGEYRVVCYYGSWAVYRPGNGKFDVEDIDPTLCTHLMYGFVGLGEGDTVRVLDSWNDLPDNYGKGAMGRFVKLKERSPKTKVMVSIGGWNEGSTKYSDMASSESRRNKFAENAVAFVKKYNFDGLDLDWEYPAQRGGKSSDKDNFPKLLEAVYNKFHENGLLFSAAFGASFNTVNLSYNIPEVSKYLDFINVMTYDYHGSWDTTTGENAPLYAHPTDTDKNMNIDSCVKNLLALGAPAEKLNLGMGTYGHSFTLQNPTNNGVNAPMTGPGEAAPYTRQTGTIGYNEICEQKSKWTVVWNDVQKVPYAYNNNQWIGYDNVKSIQIKSEYLKEKKFGGAMIWSLETDDFRNVCGEGKNPLLHTINAVLNGGTLPTGAPTTAAAAASTAGGGTAGGEAAGTTPAPATQPTEPLPPATELCDHAGYVRDKHDCQVFYECVASGSQYLVYKFKCADGTYFDTTIDQCNFADEVKC